MKWKAYERPATGSTRVRKRFAILPTLTKEGYVVWLEFYWVQEAYIYFYSTGKEKWVAINVLTNDPSRPSTGSTAQ